MVSRSIFAFCIGLLIVGAALIGCGPSPLVKLRTHPGCPWCSPNRQVQEGRRSMGQSFYGDIWKDFWLDDAGKEYDPEAVSKKVWDYLKTTGDVAKVDEALQSGKCPAQMRIVSVNPIVVLVQPCQHKRFA